MAALWCWFCLHIRYDCILWLRCIWEWKCVVPYLMRKSSESTSFYNHLAICCALFWEFFYNCSFIGDIKFCCTRSCIKIFHRWRRNFDGYNLHFNVLTVDYYVQSGKIQTKLLLWVIVICLTWQQFSKRKNRWEATYRMSWSNFI